MPRECISSGWTPTTQVIVDGYEQLGWWPRAMLKWRCQRQRAGLLVTTHRPLALPTLYHTSVSLELVQRLVGELVGGAESRITPDDVRQSFLRHQPNLREVFFALYDLYELRKPG